MNIRFRLFGIDAKIGWVWPACCVAFFALTGFMPLEVGLVTFAIGAPVYIASSHPLTSFAEFRRYLRVCRESPAMAEKEPYDVYRAIASAPDEIRDEFARLLRFLNWYDFERHEPFPGFMPRPAEPPPSPLDPYGHVPDPYRKRGPYDKSV